MRLFIQPTSRRPKRVPDGDALIFLKDTWNDFSYRTLGTLHLQREGGIVDVGVLRILGDGQVQGPSPLPDGEMPEGRLPPTFGSLGNNLDYYDRLASFGRDFARDALARLNDVAFDAAPLALLEGQDGYVRSLNRDNAVPERFYDRAREVIANGGLAPDAAGLSFTFTIPGSPQSIAFDFKPPEGAPPGGMASGPSRRVIALVGANGVGKTDVLARIARVAYAPPAARGELIADGDLLGPAFPSIVAVSYSAFDEFEPPRLDGDDVEEIAKRIEEGTGPYVYCGMRDLAGKVRRPSEPPRLLSQPELGASFTKALERIGKLDRKDLLISALLPVFSEASFRRHAIDPTARTEVEDPGTARASVAARLGDGAHAFFETLSSGHKIVLLMLTRLVAGLGKRGLALIDEPETHLHPPLLAAAMSGLRIVLEGLTSYAIVATHSPVVAQETPAHLILVMETDGGPSLCRRPQVETFGENVGTLTREIFGLHTGATDFREVLDRLQEALGTVEGIERAIGGALPGPALAHVLARAEGRL